MYRSICITGVLLWVLFNVAQPLAVQAQPEDEQTAEEPEQPPEEPSDPEGDSEEPDVVETGVEMETVVREERPISAASSKSVRDRDVSLRPLHRPADVLQVAPGMYVVQHAGGGKANQYFLRGFDADHGTDVLLMVDGVPVNNVSHGHGQGYADLNWLIPELVEQVEVMKGPYFSDAGDFATAGAINIVTRKTMEANQVALTGGSFDTYRTLAVVAPKSEAWRSLAAAEVYGSNGPFDNPEKLQRYDIFLRGSRRLGDGSLLTMGVTSYGAGWNASGQIPGRAVASGLIGRFGSIDPLEGGNSQRHSVSAHYRQSLDKGRKLDLSAHAINYRLRLFSNFTFFSADPINGDMIEQLDRRTTTGARARFHIPKFFDNGIVASTRVGTDVRNDVIETGLFTAPGRERTTTLVDGQVRQGSLGVFAQEDILWTDWLRTIVGLRADYVGFDVNDRNEDLSTLDGPTSGVSQVSILSPKSSVVLSPVKNTDVYLNFGMGHHSNDARGTVLRSGRVSPVTRAIGYEIGVRTRLFQRVDLAAAVFHLDLDGETVWIGDAGTTELSGPSQRQGFEFEVRYQIVSWLYADADASFVRARFVDEPQGFDAIPLAPELIGSAGLSWQHSKGWFGRVGLFHLGDRPANEDRSLTALGFTRLDSTLGYRRGRYEVSASLQNLTNAPIREAQFATTSRLPGENGPADCPAGTVAQGGEVAFEGCEEVNFTPGAPFNGQLTLRLFF